MPAATWVGISETGIGVSESRRHASLHRLTLFRRRIGVEQGRLVGEAERITAIAHAWQPAQGVLAGRLGQAWLQCPGGAATIKAVHVTARLQGASSNGK